MNELERLRADVERLTRERAKALEDGIEMAKMAVVDGVGTTPHLNRHIQRICGGLIKSLRARAALAETKPANPETEPRRCGIEFKPFGENSFIMSTACKLEAGHAGAHRQSATLTPGGPRTVLDSVPAPTTPEPHPEYLRGLEDAAKLADEGKHDEWSPDYIGRMIRQLAACAAPLATEPKR